MSDVDLAIVRAQVEILQYVKKQQARLKELETGARGIIEEALGGNEIGKLDGDVVVTWKHGKANRLNQSALRQAHPEIVAEFTQLNHTRSFVVQ